MREREWDELRREMGVRESTPPKREGPPHTKKPSYNVPSSRRA
jgi:hypothetical protein